MRRGRWIISIAGAACVIAIALCICRDRAAPGELSREHGQIAGLHRIDGCDRCHREEGLAAGCLSCHREIASQLSSERGLHAYLLKGKRSDCRECHLEHLGREFPLTSPRAWGPGGRGAFRHPHLAFPLAGKHDGLACEACHARPDRTPFHLADFPALPRTSTFLGVETRCASCHADPHGGESARACEECHSQEGFRPAPGFRHERFYVLGEAHRQTACDGCHPFAPRRPGRAVRLPYQEAKGKTCAACHRNPHRAIGGESCEGCHGRDSPAWSAAGSRMTAERHAEAGFHLDPPHQGTACAACHLENGPYAARYPNPAAGGYRRRHEDCEGCHGDRHQGQFTASGKGCLDCHARTAWKPARYGSAEHASFSLEGSHRAAPCGRCHPMDPERKIQIFNPTPRECKACHPDPHGGQFERELAPGDCTACHDPSATTFSIRPYDHLVSTGYPLTGRHARIGCEGCHREAEIVEPPAATVGLEPTPSAIAIGSAADSIGEAEPERSEPAAMDPGTGDPATITPGATSPGPVEGGIAGPAAALSSPPPPRTRGRRFRGLSHECAACHQDVHRGQLDREGRAVCASCHPSAVSWKETAFDHELRSGFPLDGVHRKVNCEQCHRKVTMGSEGTVVRYRPLPRDCQDCHESISN